CRKRRRWQATSRVVSGPCAQRPAAARTASTALRAAEETPRRARLSRDSVYTASFLPRQRARRRCRFPPPGCRGGKTARKQFYLCALALRSSESQTGGGVPGGLCACAVPCNETALYTTTADWNDKNPGHRPHGGWPGC